jgi:kumamolisin
MSFIVFLGMIVHASNAPAQVIGASPNSQRILKNPVKPETVRNFSRIGHLDSTTDVELTFTLPIRSTQNLQNLVERIYRKGDPLYHQFLSVDQFTSQFGPTSSDYQKLQAHLSRAGFTVSKTHANRLLLKVHAPASVVESYFSTQLDQYLKPGGTTGYAPSSDLTLPAEAAALGAEVIGVENLTEFAPHLRFANSFAVNMANLSAAERALDQPSPLFIGTGPNQGLSPIDIKKAYGLTSVPINGAGQTVGLIELDGYSSSDISTYANYFSIKPAPTLQNVLVDSYNGAAGSNSTEVVLDIEMILALAPGVSKIIVYESANQASNFADVISQAATDNTAKQISISWGSAESGNTSTSLNTLDALFLEMASQGQTVYVSSGDAGAYPNTGGSVPAVDPNVTAVGGTSLSVTGTGAYLSETSWNTSSTEGGGGGLSITYALPAYQTGLATVGNQGSNSFRMVPDVALDADPETGYAIYSGGSWQIVGGTSAAAPLWAAYNSLINEQRAGSGLGNLGFANPTLYSLEAGSGGSSEFHDIADGSTNGTYPATVGYDLTTGLGSFTGLPLIAALGGVSAVPSSAPTNLVAIDAGPNVNLSWTGITSPTAYSVLRGTVSGGPYTTLSNSCLTASYIDSSGTNGTTYYYVVAAINAYGASSVSNEVSATPTTGVPANFTATAGDGQVTLSWSAVSGAVSYNILDYNVLTANTTSLSKTITGLTDGDAQAFKVQTVFSSSVSPTTSQILATPQIAAPSGLTGTVAP